MWKHFTHLLIFSLPLFPLIADDFWPQGNSFTTDQSFAPFTGKITRNRVRVRTEPHLGAYIVRELDKDDLVIAVEETEDFYAIQPPAGTRVYVFRSYVLDNVVEGSRVNVRLEPNIESPVLAQLNSGDRVEGNISPLNSKWLEITPPEPTRFYVCKDYVEKVGDPALMTTIERRRDEVNFLLNSTYLKAQTEMQKPYPEIHLDALVEGFHQVIQEYPDFPNQVARANQLIDMLYENYLEKKIVYLESKTENSHQSWQAHDQQLAHEIEAQKFRLDELERELSGKTPGVSYSQQPTNIATPHQSTPDSFYSKPPFKQSYSSTNTMAGWQPIENTLFEQWKRQNGNSTMREFYEAQRRYAVTLRGVIQPYQRHLRHKPGDFLLMNQAGNAPIAYLYSTHVDLQNLVGQEVTLLAVPRPNYNFAFPAYFVLRID